jgi:type II secretory pathway pseudopilin PulG
MKRAIALIELIFAIVVIGITLLAVPNLLATTTKASSNAITQEAISNGASHLAMILTQYWDEQSIQAYDNPILYVTSSNSMLQEAKDSFNNSLGRRIGSNDETPRRFAKDKFGNKIYATTPTNFGLDGGETIANDIDDYANTTYTLVKREEASIAIGEYKDTKVNISTKVYYISDNTMYNRFNVTFNNPFNNKVNNSTNIKAIKVTITSLNDANKKIVLNGFSCNIGSQKLRRRDF